MNKKELGLALSRTTTTVETRHELRLTLPRLYAALVAAGYDIGETSDFKARLRAYCSTDAEVGDVESEALVVTWTNKTVK